MTVARSRSAVVVLPAALIALGGATAIAPAIGHATQCGPGTMYDAPTDMCVVAPAPPAQWDAPPPPPLPPISICPPIPFVAVCFPVN